MRNRRLLSWIGLGLATFSLMAAKTTAPTNIAPDFRLMDHQGRSLELYRQGQSKAVVLLFSDNAALEQNAAALNALAKEYADRGVLVWAINPKPSEDLASMAASVQKASVTIPFLRDSLQ